MCDTYCKIIVYWFLFGGFFISALIPVFYDIEGGEIKNLSSDKLKCLYFDYIKYRDALGTDARPVSVLEYYNANKGNYGNTTKRVSK